MFLVFVVVRRVFAADRTNLMFTHRVGKMADFSLTWRNLILVLYDICHRVALAFSHAIFEQIARPYMCLLGFT